MSEQTKFEKDLEAYFPEIYRLNSIGKWDRFIWEAVNSMVSMVDRNGSGEITIRYNCGRIDRIYLKEDILFKKGRGANLSVVSNEEIDKNDI